MDKAKNKQVIRIQSLIKYSMWSQKKDKANIQINTAVWDQRIKSGRNAL